MSARNDIVARVEDLQLGEGAHVDPWDM